MAVAAGRRRGPQPVDEGHEGQVRSITAPVRRLLAAVFPRLGLPRDGPSTGTPGLRSPLLPSWTSASARSFHLSPEWP